MIALRSYLAAQADVAESNCCQVHIVLQQLDSWHSSV